MNPAMNSPSTTHGPRLPLIGEPSEPETVAMFEEVKARTGRLLNLHRVMGYAPRLAKASMEMALQLRTGTLLPRPMIELMILRTAQTVGSDYEWQQHHPMALAIGMSEKQIDAIERWPDSDLFSEKERAALGLCDSVIAKQQLDDAAFQRLRQHFSPREIVEITVVVCEYLATAHFVRALGVPLEAARIQSAGIVETPKR
jgi:alkylhydroperoxidase family enzyme